MNVSLGNRRVLSKETLYLSSPSISGSGQIEHSLRHPSEVLSDIVAVVQPLQSPTVEEVVRGNRVLFEANAHIYSLVSRSQDMAEPKRIPDSRRQTDQ